MLNDVHNYKSSLSQKLNLSHILYPQNIWFKSKQLYDSENITEAIFVIMGAIVASNLCE